MTQLTLTSSQIAQLEPGATLVECRDAAGKLVGFLHVGGMKGPSPIPDFTSEQLASFEREPGGRSLIEILSDLRQRR
jgi:hypothetical protein